MVDDRTVIIPKPGGRLPEGLTPPPAPIPEYGHHAAEQMSFTGVNPLVEAASPLLSLMGQIRTMIATPDVNALREHMLQQIHAFENQARQNNVTTKVVYTARYVLCAALDEAVLSTVWGSRSLWTTQGLLITFHKEATGGERFFVILNGLMRDPRADMDLLELMMICLSLGFQGQYGPMERGYEKLEQIRHHIFEQIRRRRAEFKSELSPHWKGQREKTGALRRYIPLWVVAAVAGVILLTIFTVFSWMLENNAEPVYRSLQQLGTTVSGTEGTATGHAKP